MILKNTKKMLSFIVVIAVSFFMFGCDEETTVVTSTASDRTTVIGTASITVTNVIEVVVGMELPNFMDYVVLLNADAADVTINFSAVDMNTVGDYTVYFSLFSGTADQIDEQATVRVIEGSVDNSPVILGVSDMIYVLGSDDFPDIRDGVTVIDPKYGDITQLLEASSDYYYNLEVGTVDVTYYVMNHDGYSQTAHATIEIVLDDATPVISDEFVIVYDGMYGLISMTGEVLIPCEYEDMYYVGDDVLYLERDDTNYYYDMVDQTYYQYDYYFKDYFQEGLVTVSNDSELYSYMDKSGEVVMPFIYTRAYPFSNGLAIVEMGENTGLIDSQGNVIIEIMYDMVYQIADGYYMKAIDDEYTVVDTLGEDVISLSSLWSTSYELEDGTVIYQVAQDGYHILVTDQFVELLPPHYTYLNMMMNGYFYGSTIFGNYNIYNPMTHKTIFNVEDFYSDGDYLVLETSQGYGIYDIVTETYLLNPTYAKIDPFYLNEELFIATRADGMKSIIDVYGKVLSGFVFKDIYYWEVEDYAIFEDENGLLGTISAEGILLSDGEYSDILYTGADNRVVVDNVTGLYGFIDKSGVEIIEPKFYDVSSFFFDGFAMVQKVDDDLGWTYVREDGTYISETLYQRSADFHDGYAKVRVADQLGVAYWKIINTEGTELTSDAYYTVYDMIDGYAVVKKENNNNSYGMIDSSGNIVVPCSYGKVYNQSDNMIRVKDENKLYGYYKTNQTLVVTPMYYAASDFSNGRAIVENESGYQAIISNTGDYIKTFEAIEIRDYASNVAVYNEIGSTVYGLLNLNGMVVLEPTYSYIGDFVNGMAIAKLNNGGYSYINTRGEVLIEGPYDAASPFREDAPYAIVYLDDKIGIINTDGETVFDIAYQIWFTDEGYIVRDLFEYDLEVLVVNETLAYTIVGADEKVYTMVYDDGWMLYDGETMVVDKGYDLIEYMEDTGLWIVTKDSLKGLLDAEFNQLVEPTYDNILYNSKSSSIKVDINGNYGVLSVEGELLVPAIYDFVSCSPDGSMCVVGLGPVVGMYNIEEGLFIPVQYFDLEYVNTDSSETEMQEMPK